MKPPLYYEKLIEAVTDEDRAWFEEHPDEQVRFRQIVPGEFWPVEYPCVAQVAVCRLGPGVRLRTVAA